MIQMKNNQNNQKLNQIDIDKSEEFDIEDLDHIKVNNNFMREKQEIATRPFTANERSPRNKCK